ncbi:hypothetical protein NDN08_001145 [Rhodosorus marinus]|uniref:Oxidoreductase n=1 Tax=Rhodosorus marinus TaxID=101924 RepID=A0AAV8UU63_9RHOD|nr:hypothetical protein NDN08_001145 [Rhodosorus marinus]
MNERLDLASTSSFSSRLSSRGPDTPESMVFARRLNVVVTGGSSGIGKAIVEEFAREGHRVLFTYLRNLDGVAALKSKYVHVTAVRLDQGDEKSVSEFVAETKVWLEDAEVPHVDVIINNAALGSATVDSYCGEGATEFEKDTALMRVNSLGPLWVSRGLIPLRKQEERTVVVFVGSVGGGSAAVFPEYHAADLMSKAAVAYLSKHLAADNVHSNVDIFCISPGATETEMFQKSTLSQLDDPDSFIAGMPKGVLISPTHVAENIFYLSTSPASKMFHGAVIDASMGLAVRPGLQTESRRC